MSDDNPFNGLDDLDEDDEQDETATDTTADTMEGKDDGPETADPLQQPAFEYDKDIREYYYARPETWGAFEDLVFNAQVQLRQEYDLRDVPKRELHEAAMQAFLDQTPAEAVAENVVKARRRGGDD